MDGNVSFVIDERIKRTINSLKKNNIEGYYVQDKKQLTEKIKSFLKKGDTVAVGGSMTLFETGIIDFLRNGDYNFIDRYEENLKKEDMKKIFRKSFLVDDYLVSSNAITEKGEIYNVDGNGNRVAAMIYGPDNVIIVIGYNKIVKDLDEAMERCSSISAPANAKRLNLKTPCAVLGECMDCDSEGRICNYYTVIRRQNKNGRIKVIIVGEELGY